MSHADFEDVAFIPHVFLSDPRHYWLHAFKPAPRIKKRALLAGMQFETALGTLPYARASRTLQYGSTLSAARDCSGSWKIHRFGS